MDGVEVRDAGVKGKGTFTTREFMRGERVLDFGGELMTGADIPESVEVDHYLQIDVDLFLGPSGKADDFVNHSCDPTCFVVVVGQSSWLVANRDMASGDEVTFDYSTTIAEEVYLMACDCSTPVCRGAASPYRDLPAEVRRDYEIRGLVPEFVLRSVM